MLLSEDDAATLLGTLEASLREAGYVDTAARIREVSVGPIDVDEFDDGFARYRRVVLSRANADGDATVDDPPPTIRLLAAIKIVDLMVVEPLRIEQAVPKLLARARLDIAGITVGPDDTFMLRPQPTQRTDEALTEWTHLLSTLREQVVSEDGTANDR
jgi:hypothetical protein